MESVFGEKDFLACCGSFKFAKEMVSTGPFASNEEAVDAARDIWFNKVDVNGWLEAFAAHPQIGESPSPNHKSPTSAQFCSLSLSLARTHARTHMQKNLKWSKGEQSTAFATATDSSLQELYDWNIRYKQKFGFVFLICASGKSTPEILTELKRRYPNRPIIEFEIAAQEQMKIIELRLSMLFSVKANAATTSAQYTADVVSKAGEDRASIIGAHLTAASEAPVGKPSQIPTRTRPPITTHVLDVAHGSPAAGMEVRLEMWRSNQPRPLFSDTDVGSWIFQGYSTTDKDGRSGQLISMVDALNPGIYRISFNTGKYCPDGFYPYVSIVFEIRESQKWEHFHVPLLLSPFSFSTYRGT